MREIKFRAWNKIWKMMSMVDKIEFEDGNPYSVSTTIEATDFDHTDEWSDYEVGDEIILQQFTGLKDKNGKDIYEGDILHEFKEKTAPIANNGINRKFVVDDIRELEFSPLNCEVIGNTFENPELINHPLT